jgi:PGF-CTERM protein
MNSRQSWISLLLALALVSVPLAGGGLAVSPTDEAATDQQGAELGVSNDTAASQSSAPPDPDEDVLGWENGYWHNESISVTREDGLNETELDAVVARGMARVEYIRRIEFDGAPPVEIISREEFAEQNQQQFGNVTEADRLRHNVKYEALFMVGEDENSVAVEQNNRAGGVGGFYDPAANEIKIVSENTSTPKLDEITLSQELFHALQDQTFNISEYDQSTRELHNAKDGIIEGDGNYVDQLYQEECENGQWEGTCLFPEEQGAPEGFDPHLGLYQITFQPYSTGPGFVHDIYQSGGWEAVNEIYESPPESTEQTIHPQKYGEDEPVNVTVEDTSQGDWQRLERNQSNSDISPAQFGEAGLFVALWYPGFETQTQTTIIPYESHLNLTDSGRISESEPYLYDHPATAGWGGEALVPYVTDDSAETNETGYVYKIVWDSPADAQEFQQKWLELMEYRGATPVDGHEETYRISDEKPFGDAFYVTQNNDTIKIINAPTVSAIAQIEEGAAPETQEGDGSADNNDDEGDSNSSSGNGDDNATDGSDDNTGGDETGETETDANDESEPAETGTETDANDESEPAETGTETDANDGPGFTLGVALLALLGGAILAVKRQG